MSAKQASCEERIAQELESRLEDFRDLDTLASQSVASGGSDDISAEAKAAADRLGIDVPKATDDLVEAAQERLYEYPLGIDKQILHRIDISTGGPADWLEVVQSEDGPIQRITYHFSDWFDHAEKTLEGPEYEAAESFVTALIPDLQ